MGENGTFYCNTVNYSTEWRISTQSGSRDLITEFIVRSKETLEILAEEDQIFITGNWVNSTYRSTLTITGNTKNNFTRVQCGQARGVNFGDKDFTAGVFLRVVGK